MLFINFDIVLVGQSLGYDLLIEESKSKYVSSSQGAHVMELNKHTLESILIKISSSAQVTFGSDSLRKMLFDFRVKGDLSNTESIVEDILYTLDLNHGLKSKISGKGVRGYTLTYKDFESQCEDSIYLNKVYEINRVWHGECVELKVVAEKVRDWYGVEVTAQRSAVKIANLSLHYDEFDIFKEYLRMNNLFLVSNDTSKSRTLNYHIFK